MIRERDIQEAILDYLQARRIFAFRTNTGAAMLPGRNGKRQLVRFGFRGVADIIGIVPGEDSVGTYGQFLAIEVKGPKGKQTEDQKAFEEAVKKNGGIYCLARSVDDVRKALEG